MKRPYLILTLLLSGLGLIYGMIVQLNPTLFGRIFDENRWAAYRVEGRLDSRFSGDRLKWEIRWPINRKSFTNVASGHSASTGRYRDISWTESYRWDNRMDSGKFWLAGGYEKSGDPVLYRKSPTLFPLFFPGKYEILAQSGRIDFQSLPILTRRYQPLRWEAGTYAESCLWHDSEPLGLRRAWKTFLVDRQGNKTGWSVHDQDTGLLLELADSYGEGEGKLSLFKADRKTLMKPVAFFALMILATLGWLAVFAKKVAPPGTGKVGLVRYGLTVLAIPLFDLGRICAFDRWLGGPTGVVIWEALALVAMLIAAGPWGALMALRLLAVATGQTALGLFPMASVVLLLRWGVRRRKRSAPSSPPVSPEEATT